MTRAFVLSGGGNLGAVQVGMLDALRERGIVPDLLVGTSVGALNAAYVAGRGMNADAIEDLTTVWLRVRRRDVFPFDPVRHVLALSGRRPSLCSNDALRRLVADTLPYRMLEDAAVRAKMGKLYAETVSGNRDRLKLFEDLKIPAFPGGRTFRAPLLFLALNWYALRDRF